MSWRCLSKARRQPRSQKIAESLSAKYIRIPLAVFRKFDDSYGYAVAGIKTAPVSLNSLASHFECNAHDPLRFRVKLLAAKEWCDWHDPIRSPSHSTKRERQSRFRQLRADNGPNRCVPITVPLADSIRVKFIPGEPGC